MQVNVSGLAAGALERSIQRECSRAYRRVATLAARIDRLDRQLGTAQAVAEELRDLLDEVRLARHHVPMLADD